MPSSSEQLVELPPVEPGPIEDWDEYFLELAQTVKRKSKDPRCPVGAVIVRDRRTLSTGFNGFARGVFDDPALLANVDEKLKLVCHAEVNAIFNAAALGVALEGATIYVTKFPCLACCNAIIQAGVKTIYTHDKKYWGDDPFDKEHTRKKAALKQAGIKVIAPFHPDFMPTERNGKFSVVATVKPPANDGPIEKAPTAPKSKAKRKGPKAAKPKDQTSLWPAREPIPGGKSS